MATTSQGAQLGSRYERILKGRKDTDLEAANTLASMSTYVSPSGVNLRIKNNATSQGFPTFPEQLINILDNKET